MLQVKSVSTRPTCLCSSMKPGQTEETHFVSMDIGGEENLFSSQTISERSAFFYNSFHEHCRFAGLCYIL